MRRWTSCVGVVGVLCHIVSRRFAWLLKYIFSGERVFRPINVSGVDWHVPHLCKGKSDTF